MKKKLASLLFFLCLLGLIFSVAIMHAGQANTLAEDLISTPEISILETIDATTLKFTLADTKNMDGYEIRIVSVKDGKTLVATGDALGIHTGTAAGSFLGIKTVSNLKEGESYDVSIRGYKNLNTVGLRYSDWSAAERITMRENIVAFQGHQYRFVPALDYPTWEEISAYCKAEGGYPASILSAEENKFLYKAMHLKGFEDAYFGYTDIETEGVWKWESGEVSPFSKWYTQAVDNYENEDYAMFWRKIAGPYWNDGALRNLDEKVAFICEWGELKPAPSPTPTPTQAPKRAPVDEVLDLKPEDFTYKSVSGYYSCTGLSESGYKKFSKYLSQDTVTIHLPAVSDTGKKVRGFYSDSPKGYDLGDLMVSTSPYIRLVCPDTYVIYSGETGSATDKVISVELNEGMKTLYKRAFYNYTGLTRMVLPESIKTYRAEVFKGCTNLVIETLVTDGVAMGSAVFEGVTIKNLYISEKYDATSETVSTLYRANIENIHFEHGIKKIPDDAFRQCYILTKIKIPDTVKTIGKRAFKQCSSLMSVEFSEVLDKVELGAEAFYGCYLLENERLPDNIKTYGDKAFYGCVSLKIEYFDTSEKKINGSAFHGVRIDSLLITESLSAVDYGVNKSSDGAFEGAVLNNIIFESGIGELPANTFRGCTGITEIAIPETVTYIGNYAFRGCENLERVILPESVNEIGKGAFYDCSVLKEIQLDNVGVFGEEAFRQCNKLVIDSLDTSGISIKSSAFSGVKINELVICNGFIGVPYNNGKENKGSLDGVKIGKLVFKEGISAVGDDTFRNCTSITEILIPDTVISIGERAFASCTGLKKVVIPETVKVIGKEAFLNCTALTRVEHPEGMVLGENAFKGCTKVKLVPYKKGR